MQKITPHFWFDKEAKEAAEFYTSLLPDFKSDEYCHAARYSLR